MSSVYNLLRLLTTRQGDKESLLDYMERLKIERNVVKSQFGIDLFHGFSENTKEYKHTEDLAKKQALKDMSFDKIMACIQLRNSNRSKYATLITNRSSDYSMGVKNTLKHYWK